MAIDTAEKRRSVAGIPTAFVLGVTPNTSKDSEWRSQVAWGYSGIPPGGTPPVVAAQPDYTGMVVNVGRLMMR